MIRLAYIIEHVAGSGGLERNITTKANYLMAKDEYEITIITLSQNGRPFTYEIDDRIKMIDLGIDFSGKKSSGITKEIGIKLQSVLLSNNFDICISWGGLDVYSLYKINDGSKKVVEYHFNYTAFDNWAPSSLPSLLRKIYANIKRRAFIAAIRHYDCFAVLTKEDKHKWGKYCSNVDFIYNPLLIDKKECDKKTENSKKVCAIGRLDKQKGYDLLIPAWTEVAKLHPDWTLNIYGDGPERDSLQELINQNGLQDKVILHGYCANIPEILSQSEIFAFPSRHEGFGNVLVEAMTYGVPPISFDCPCGPSEIIENGKSGIVVPYLDIDALITEVIRLIENPKERIRLSENAKVRSKDFSKSVIMDLWDKQIKQLL